MKILYALAWQTSNSLPLIVKSIDGENWAPGRCEKVTASKLLPLASFSHLLPIGYDFVALMFAALRYPAHDRFTPEAYTAEVDKEFSTFNMDN